MPVNNPPPAGGGSGGGAPTNAEYITASNDPTLTAERVLTGVANETSIDNATAGQSKVSIAPHNALADPHPQYAFDTDLGLYVPKSLLSTKGDIMSRDGTGPVRKAVGANGTALFADSAQTDGLNWRVIAEGDVTNLTTDLGNKIDKSIVTTKGDIIARNGTGPVRHGVGADGTFLKADSTQADGVNWATPSDPPGQYDPSLNSFLAWTFDLKFGVSAIATTTLVPCLFKIRVPRTITITSLVVWIQGAGATLVAGSNRVGVYDSTGTLLSQSADITAWATTTALTVNLGTPQTITGGPTVFVWFALLASATTMPTFLRVGAPQSATTLNMGTAAGTKRAATLAAVTSGNGLPASFTPSTGLTAFGQMIFMGAV